MKESSPMTNEEVNQRNPSSTITHKKLKKQRILSIPSIGIKAT
jgi:hypothetical protein